MNQQEMTDRIATGQGFIAALDQSGGSTPKALRGYGIEEGAWNGDDEMFALIHEMRSRIIESPCFGNGKVLGAILFEKTMDGMSGGKSVPDRLKERGIVPFLKVDKGLEDEANGVQLMKPMPDLEGLLARARDKGVFGTKMRSVIKANDTAGIKAVVHQQFAEGARILAMGLMPILEPEYDITAADRAEGEKVLLAAIEEGLDALPEGLETEVGERGASLSLGQRQLVCFARAMLADPRILILDEATSSIDVMTEYRIQKALAKLLESGALAKLKPASKRSRAKR